MRLDVEAIEDTPVVDVTTESYIKDLELEIASLQKQIRLLTKEKKAKEPEDVNCCEGYKILVANFHKLLDDILPF